MLVITMMRNKRKRKGKDKESYICIVYTKHICLWFQADHHILQGDGVVGHAWAGKNVDSLGVCQVEDDGSMDKVGVCTSRIVGTKQFAMGRQEIFFRLTRT